MSVSNLFAQTGNIKGKVIDKKTKETLVGVIVKLENPSKGVITDLDGGFILNNLPEGTYNLEISYISYSTKKIKGVKVNADKTTELNIEMEQDSKQLGEVTVSETKVTNTETAGVMEMKKSSSIVNTISAAQISKSQDRDASEVVRRIPGVSIVENRFIMVRGLADRYNTVWMNDACAPSSEVDKKAFSFDMVTSGLIDRMLVYKTASPELPGDFAGGMVKIYTTAMPQKTNFMAQYQSSYRDNSTYTPYYHTKTYSNDWLGMGYKDRAIPNGTPANLNSSNYSTSDINNFSRSFNNDWTIYKQRSDPDQRFNTAFSGVIKKGNFKFGSVSAINYAKTYQTFNIHRQFWDSTKQETDWTDIQSTGTVRVTAIQNFAVSYKDHKIEFRNFFNQLGRSQVTQRSSNYLAGPNERTYAELYDNRTTFSSQLSGTHSFFDGKTEYTWTGGYAYNHKDMPDYKRITYNKQRNQPDSAYYTSIPSGSANITNGGRFFSNLNETIKSFNHNIKQTIKLWNYSFDLNAGNYFEYKDRAFSAREFGYVIRSSQQAYYMKFLPLDQIFSSVNVGTPGGFHLDEQTKSYDKYNAQNKLVSTYLAGNFPIGMHIKLQGGARYEYNVQSLQSHVNQDTLHPSIITKYWLPSVNTSYSFNFKKPKEENKNYKNILRASYSKTLNRPEFREWAPLYFYDFEFNAGIYGSLYPSVVNPTGGVLKIAEIQNYDVRYEFYPSAGEYIQFGAFYKTFINPIQQVILFSGGGDSPAFTFVNADNAIVKGVEVDVRKNMAFIDKILAIRVFKNFNVIGNISLMQSNMNISKVINQATKTPLQGQSPYLANGGIYYQNDSTGTQISLLYNIFGSRLFYLGTINSASIGEMGRKTLDISISQRIYKRIAFTFSVQNILNAPFRLVQDVNRDGKFTLSNNDREVMYYRMGAYYSAGIKVNF